MLAANARQFSLIADHCESASIDHEPAACSSSSSGDVLDGKSTLHTVKKDLCDSGWDSGDHSVDLSVDRSVDLNVDQSVDHGVEDCVDVDHCKQSIESNPNNTVDQLDCHSAVGRLECLSCHKKTSGCINNTASYGEICSSITEKNRTSESVVVDSCVTALSQPVICAECSCSASLAGEVSPSCARNIELNLSQGVRRNNTSIQKYYNGIITCYDDEDDIVNTEDDDEDVSSNTTDIISIEQSEEETLLNETTLEPDQLTDNIVLRLGKRPPNDNGDGGDDEEVADDIIGLSDSSLSHDSQPSSVIIEMPDDYEEEDGNIHLIGNSPLQLSNSVCCDYQTSCDNIIADSGHLSFTSRLQYSEKRLYSCANGISCKQVDTSVPDSRHTSVPDARSLYGRNNVLGGIPLVSMSNAHKEDTYKKRMLESCKGCTVLEDYLNTTSKLSYVTV